MADKLLSFTAEKIDELLNKVDSNESFTSEEKEKLASLENYTHPPKHEATVITEDETHRFVTDAEKNKWNNKADGTHTHDTYAEKSHNHTKANITDFAHTHNKSEITDFTHRHTKADISDYTEYVLPKATSEVLGGVKIGEGIKVSEGTISLGEHEHTKASISDFAHTHSKAEITDFTHRHSKSDIEDLGVIPTKVSQLTNDSNFATETFVTTKISEAQLSGDNSDIDLSGYATKEELKTKVDKVEGKSLLENTEIERLKTLKNYNDTEIKGMINNKADKTSLHSHANMEELNKIVAGDKAKWDAKSDFDGDYNSLENKPDNDLTNELKTNYDKAYTHSQVAHAPATAQKNSDITKAEIEAKLVGNITTHEHSKYSLTSHNHNDAYEPKITTKKTAFNKDFGTLEGTVAEGNHTHEGYAQANHNHDAVYSKINHNHNDVYEPKIAEKKSAFNKDFGTDEDTVAKGNHTHSNYSVTTHNHDNVYAKQSETYSKVETDGRIAEEIAKAQISGDNEVDLSGYATKVELESKANKVHTHDEYASSEHNHNEVYEPKIATKKTAFNKDFGKSAGQVAEGNHTHDGYASVEHTHEDVYASISHNHNSLYAVKSSEHTHTNKVALDKISDEKINEWNSKADGSHTHEGFATTSHKHDEVYSKLDHNHSKVYEPIIAEKKTAFNKDFGTTEGTIAKGNHTHEDLSPKTHTHTKANITDFPTKLSQFQNDMNLTSGTDGREVELQKTDTHIQWKYAGEDVWNNLVALADIKGNKGDKGDIGLGWLFGKNVPTNEGKEGELYLQYTTFDVYKKTGGTWQKIDTIKGTDGRDGENGRNISLQKSESHIQWKVNDGIDTWHNLIALSDIKGDKGDKGEDNIGHTHENKTTLDKINEGNLTNWGSAYTHSTSAHAPSDAQKNSDITKAEIEAKLIGNITTHEHNKYSLTSHNHDESYANKSSEHTHANKTSLDKISDEKINQWNSKADGNHTHTGFASTLHNHDDVYSGISHNHNSVYEPIITTKKTAFNKDFGTTEGTVAKGNHVHEEYANISHTHTKANISDFPTKLSQFQNDMNLTSGVDGKEVELQKSATHIQWRYVGEGEWHNLVALDDLRGNTGAKGEGGLGWLFGRNVPTNEGRDGDLYLQYTTFDVYKRTGGRWEKTGCIKGADGSNGVNGKNISLQKSTTHIQWKVNDDVDTWHNLVALEDLKGDKGDQGDVADTHTHENLDTLNKVVESKLTNWDNAYTHSTSAHAPSNAQKNSDITKAEIEAKLVGNIESHIHTMYQPLINPKKTAFNKDFGTGAGQVAEGNHTHTGYANAEHNHDAVYSNISHNHNSMYEPIIATKKTAFNKDFGSTEGTIAKGNHTHEDYAVTNHNHDTLYSKTTHNHNTLYEPLIAVKKSAFNKDFGTGVGQVAEGNHTHEEYSRKVETYTKSETDNKINELIEVSQTIKFWVGTKAEYDVISPKNTNTIYFIKEV